MTRNRTAERSGIARDQGGFVLLMGVAMGSVLAISLWYLMSVGDAILVRERMQDAADAVALDTATWHARGMNAVALLNMIMALAFTVMIAIRMAELVVAAGLIVCHVVTALLPPAEAACLGLDGTALNLMVRTEMTIGGRILQGIQIANWVQAGVAVITPIEAVTVGVSASERAYTGDGRIAGVSAFSFSVIPSGVEILAGAAQSGRFPSTILDGALGKVSPVKDLVDNDPISGALLSSVVQGATSAIPSLPIQADDFGSLCSRSGEMVATAAQLDQIVEVVLLDKIRESLGRIEIVGPIVERLIPSHLLDVAHDASRLLTLATGKVLGSDLGQKVFCTPVLELVADAAEAAAEKVGNGDDVLDEKAGGSDEQRKSHGIVGFIKSKIASLFGKAKKSLQELAETAKDKAQKLADDTKAVRGPSVDDLKTAKLWEFADNGNPFMHTWSTATGNNGGGGGAWFQVERDPVTAEGEFYANCYDSAWNGDGAAAIDGFFSLAHSCRDDLMWRLAWTARMRRYRDASTEIRTGLADTLTKLMDDGLATATDALSDDWKKRPENQHKSESSNPYERSKTMWEGKDLPNGDKIPGISQIRDDAVEHMRGKEKHNHVQSLIIH